MIKSACGTEAGLLWHAGSGQGLSPDGQRIASERPGHGILKRVLALRILEGIPEEFTHCTEVHGLTLEW